MGFPFLFLRLRVQSRLPSGAKIPFATCMCTPLNLLFTWQPDRDRDDMHDIQVVVPDLQGREVREKGISNKETHKHPVINGPLRWGEGEEKRERARKGGGYQVGRGHTLKQNVGKRIGTSMSKAKGSPSILSSLSKYCKERNTWPLTSDPKSDLQPLTSNLCLTPQISIFGQPLY